MDVNDLRTRVEVAMETLLRAADARVNWKQQQLEDSASGSDSPYTFLPGVYRTPCTVESGGSTGVNSECGCYSILLHGDNTFEYTWTMHRPAPRAMEYTVEITGDWSKPVLNRSRRGDEDQRLFLTSRRIRFQRLSNYDSENQTWKLCLKTLTRQGSEWAPVGETDRGIPPIVMTFNCTDGILESTGSVLPSQVLSNSPACRVLAGLTKKIANKLGGPIDVMTEKWLPSRNSKIVISRSESTLVKKFNPFYCLAQALRGTKEVSQRDHDGTVVA